MLGFYVLKKMFFFTLRLERRSIIKNEWTQMPLNLSQHKMYHVSKLVLAVKLHDLNKKMDRWLL